MKSRPRIHSLDLLRGIVMVVMTLGHVYDFAAGSGMDPREPVQALLFVTRWIPRFCAPVFVFLAGISAYLYGRGKAPADVSWLLLSRGLWLVVLELTLVRWSWTFAVVPQLVLLQVIWVTGWSMVALSVLHRLPLHVLATVSLAMIAGHNLLDGVTDATVGWWWELVHGFGPLPALGNLKPFVAYAFIPWIGVMSAGYCFGAIVVQPAEPRRRAFLTIGVGAIAAFIILRGTNLYGDPGTWRIQPTSWETVLAFVNTNKYPPSLLFLLMTLGPAILFLELVDGMKVGPIARPFVTFGRVPLFYYLLHLPLIHFVVLVVVWSMHGNVDFLLNGFAPMSPPEHDLPLPLIYSLWLAIVLALLPACRWFADVKQRRSDWWLRYL